MYTESKRNSVKFETEEEEGNKQDIDLKNKLKMGTG